MFFTKRSATRIDALPLAKPEFHVAGLDVDASTQEATLGVLKAGSVDHLVDDGIDRRRYIPSSIPKPMS